MTPADRTKGESPVMEVSMGLLEMPSYSWRGECPSRSLSQEGTWV